MTALVPLALLGWTAVALLFFARLPKPHAVVAVFVFGVLFLPEIAPVPRVPEMPSALSFPGFKLTKLNAISYAALIASLFFSGKRWLSFRPRWFDLPMLVWCLCPLFSSLSNDLGLYDGLAGIQEQTLIWGVAYLMGRLFLGDPAGLRALALGVVLGGLVYVPLCLYEMRMSPQLHPLLYGFHQHEFGQTIRFGGYRPMVFMQHGLAVGLWMTAALVTALWMYITGAVRGLRVLPGLRSWPMGWAVLILLATAGLCLSLGALVIGAAGFVTLLLSRKTKAPIAMAAFLMIAPLYIGLRTLSAWHGEELVRWAGASINEERAQSLEFRLANEDLMVANALERQVFGWGGWGRNLVYIHSQGEEISVTDSGWIIAFGQYGWVGLIAFCLTLLLPAARFTWLYPPRRWSVPVLAPAAAMAVLLALVMMDKLLNAMDNPVFMLAAGGLAGLTDFSRIRPEQNTSSRGQEMSATEPARA